jgi:DNA-binding beta-propeller fold protein YncE
MSIHDLARQRLLPVATAFATLALAAATLPASAQQQSTGFTAFESGQVRPLALARSAETTRLFAVNTPDSRVEIFQVDAQSGLLTAEASVQVGLEPVAIATRTPNEVWVANHLSDSLSVIRRNELGVWQVTATLYTGDEPRDIVFGGPNRSHAYVTVANRNVIARPPGDSVGTAEVWVFDATAVGAGGPEVAPVAVVNMFAEVPRGLAVSPDGDTLYVGTFFSGNRTAVLGAREMQGQQGLPPFVNVDGDEAPRQKLIVQQQDDGRWLDAGGFDRSDLIDIDLPDNDVFTLDISNPAAPQVVDSYSGVGTILFNLAVNPASGAVYVSNFESNNMTRFEGKGEFYDSTVRGDTVRNRITVIKDGAVLPRHLNKHIDYGTDLGTPEERELSLAQPMEMVVSGNGSALYVVAMGSNKVGIYSTAALESDQFQPRLDRQIEVSGGGPTGLVLDEPAKRLYVLTRYNNGVSVIDLQAKQEIQNVPMFNPEPPEIVAGRPFLYDATITSSRGNNTCASCHVFGDVDHLAWDLGDPDGSVLANPNPFNFQEEGVDIDFHPMKSVMTTQSLRGMIDSGPLHWRGDKTGGTKGGDPLDAVLGFLEFDKAYDGVNMFGGPLPLDQMQQFADFIMQVKYPPNPNRRIDNVLTPEQASGRDTYLNVFLTVKNGEPATCNSCHTLDPANAFFGTNGLSATRERRPDTPAMKIPHIRNLYTKLSAPLTVEKMSGPQIRGFFAAHDGSTDNLLRFVNADNFLFPGGEQQQMDMIHFLQAFDTNLHPGVGQQVTLSAANFASAQGRVNLLYQIAQQSFQPTGFACDLVVKGVVRGEPWGWVLSRNPVGFQSDRGVPFTLKQLKGIARTQGALTFTCVPPGDGVRLGIDRDLDGILDGNDI